MKKRVIAAVIMGTTGLGLSTAFAKECDVSEQSQHQYQVVPVSPKKILSIHKRTATGSDGIAYTTDGNILRDSEVQTKPDQVCPGEVKYTLYASRREFNRLKSDGKITVSILPQFNKNTSYDIYCLPVPVKDNNVVITGNEARINFTPDESEAMRRKRREDLVTKGVGCYVIDHGAVKTEPVKPKQPVIAAPVGEDVVPVEPQQKDNGVPNIFNIFKPLFGG